MQALKDIPAVNAEIDGTDIVYKNYYHIGVAVGTDKGLVVPVVRDCDRKSLAEIEKEIADFGRRARDGTLKIEEMQGGTFTISQRRRLRLADVDADPQCAAVRHPRHAQDPGRRGGRRQDRARPMMYLALTYDHRSSTGAADDVPGAVLRYRVVDGREAVHVPGCG